MNFKEFYEFNEILNLIVEEEATPVDKSEIKDIATKTGIFNKISFKDVLKVIGIGKDKLTSNETKTGLKIVSQGINIIDNISASIKTTASGGNSTSGGGIFTSILRYNNPILKKITPEKASMDLIEIIVKKLNFKADNSKVFSLIKFKVMFEKFIEDNQIPDENTYKYLRTILTSVPGVTVTKKNIRDDFYIKSIAPKKETPAAKKRRLLKDKKNKLEEKKYIDKWNKKFISFLDNPYWSSEVHEALAALFSEYHIEITMNAEEIKNDLGQLFTKVFSREILSFLSSLSKVAKNFVTVLLSVYLLKIIKRIAFK